MPITKQIQKKHFSKSQYKSNSRALESALSSNSTTKLKKKIRDLERYLKNQKQNDKHNSTQLAENERILNALKIKLQNQNLNLKQKHLLKKYHMVKFFEKKKTIRVLKKSNQQLIDLKKINIDDNQINQIENQLLNSKVDLLYIINFPKDKKYIALYPNTSKDNNTEKVDEKTLKGIQKSNKFKDEFRAKMKSLILTNNHDFNFEDIINNKKSIKINHHIDSIKAQVIANVDEADKIVFKSNNQSSNYTKVPKINHADNNYITINKNKNNDNDEEDDFFE
ncbi:Efg1p ASCRUDRAFT_78252 [Ascoidea rubescens DSM 1968]|uniref:rRNA-processing protein EFG1 n=1 Tax=Ascoidea rubescens DSM 1968 TaxID=1344418 RepID=A0A1D2V8V8_9ASCO|nr:hypothetical protein ASCRUDRAFT_78252 [Ascoidea rubescens DSM 1968]ODV57947.1 hypothetical protein ASCRUDRAFT_78252 [Ascoidea rubescens DSM 1968]